MAFEVFKKRVSAIVSKAGASVRFHHEDDGSIMMAAISPTALMA